VFPAATLRDMQTNESRWLRTLRTALLTSAAVSLPLAAAPPPDLHLLWSTAGASVSGAAGSSASLEYELTNIGGSPAFAVILKAHTTVGPVGPPLRLQPGPAAGASVQRKVTFALVRGMREICVDATLQTRGEREPPEANLQNNRICRAVVINTPARSEETSR
jgi:hypothetical protein